MLRGKRAALMVAILVVFLAASSAQAVQYAMNFSGVGTVPSAGWITFANLGDTIPASWEVHLAEQVITSSNSFVVSSGVSFLQVVWEGGEPVDVVDIFAVLAADGSTIFAFGMNRRWQERQVFTGVTRDGELTFSVVPEPSGLLLVGAGLAWLARRRPLREASAPEMSNPRRLDQM